MSDNTNLQRAKNQKDDGWPTPAWMAERIFDKATTELRDMSVYCPCDGPNSEFTRYFIRNFYRLGLRELVCTNYAPGNRGTLIKYDREGYSENLLDGDGDFRSRECCTIRDCSDIIITNPPWSLVARNYLPWLDNKEYIMICNIMTLTYKNLWNLKPFFCLANNLHFETKTTKGNEPKGMILSSINLPYTFPAGRFGCLSDDTSEGIATQEGLLLYNDSSKIPIYTPIKTRLLAPLSAISMQRLYDAGYTVIGYVNVPHGVDGKTYFSKLIIEKVSEALDNL